MDVGTGTVAKDTNFTHFNVQLLVRWVFETIGIGSVLLILFFNIIYYCDDHELISLFVHA